MQKIQLLLLALFAVITVSCSKKCLCIAYNKETLEPTEIVFEKEMPRSLKLDCSFFNERIDTVYIYTCK